MAVDKHGGKTTNGTSGNGVALNGRSATRKRPSSLMQVASSLPTVEHSLDEFIAKANQTTVDASTWKEAEQAAREEDEKRRVVDAMRMKAAETQLREGEARETALRRQLDGLQGQLAEAEARAAVAGTAVGSAAHDAMMSELRAKIEKAEQRMRVAEEKNQEMTEALTRAKDEAVRAAATATPVEIDGSAAEVTERLRIAEAKAARAIAAAKAAQAGLSVSPSDLAALESGIPMAELAPAKRSSMPIVLGIIGGVALTLVLVVVALKFLVAAPVAPAAVAPAVQPAAVAAPAAAAQPAATTVTPVTPAAPAAAAAPSVTPIDEPAPASADVKAEPVAEPAAVKPEPVAPAAPEVVKAEPTAAKTEKTEKVEKPVKKERPKKADSPAPKKAKKSEAKPSGGIVDPF
ncbi:MAG: hypothetical protein AB7R00_29265 [Kofleriaceae bacterium]